jgi:L-rhamnose-H+ transport protein
MQIKGWTGLAAALLAGAINGSVLMPMKFVRNWAWENTWLLFAICAYVLSPWTVALYSIPHLGAVYGQAGLRVTAVTCLLGVGWGLAVVLFGLAVSTVGLSISSAILYGCSVALGSLGALALIDRSRLLTPDGFKILLWDLVLLLGVLFCAQAGRTREPAAALHDRARTRRGVGISFLAGLLSTLFNIVLAYGDPIRHIAVALGADPSAATNAIWSLAVTSGSVPSIVWCILLLYRNKRWALYRDRFSGRNVLLCMGMGAAWILATVMYGFATTRLGAYGTALGWPVYMSATILAGITWGLALGEWRGASRPSVRLLWAGVGTQVLAIVLLSAV